jgi:hypothetical protein
VSLNRTEHKLKTGKVNTEDASFYGEHLSPVSVLPLRAPTLPTIVMSAPLQTVGKKQGAYRFIFLVVMFEAFK